MWIEQAPAASTPKKRPRIHRVGVVEGVLAQELLLHGAPALLAAELPVEGIQGFPLGVELVLVSFDGLHNIRRVHLNDSHAGSVERDMVENN